MTQPTSIERYNERRLTVCYSNVIVHAMLRQTGLSHYTLDKSVGVKKFSLSHNLKMRNFVLRDFSHFRLLRLSPQTQKTKISSSSYAPYGAYNVEVYKTEIHFPTKCRKVKNNNNRMLKPTFRQFGGKLKKHKIRIFATSDQLGRSCFLFLRKNDFIKNYFFRLCPTSVSKSNPFELIFLF